MKTFYSFYNTSVFRLALIWVLLGVASLSQAQVYYSMGDGAAASLLDQLRRAPLAGGPEQILVNSNTTNFAASPGGLALDLANNRILVINSINNSPRIVAVDLTSGAVSTFLTPAPITGATNNSLTGIAIDNTNAQVYYSMGDGAAASFLDQLRRAPLAGGPEQILVNSNTTNFAASPGGLALDLANNRILVINSINNSPRIVAVNLTSGAVSTFLTPAPITGATNNSLTGIAIDNTNAQVYYSMGDGAAASLLDQLRRAPLAGGPEQILVNSNTTNFAASPGGLALDLANNRILVINSINNSPRIVAVNLTSGAVSTFLTPAPITGATNNSLTGIAILPAPTTITSINRSSNNPTNASSVNYTVVFGSSVTGLTTSNFGLTTSGLSGATINSVSGSGTTYTVSVNTGSGDGSLTLRLTNATGLSPSISTSLPFNGQSYTVDKTAPTPTITSSASNPTTSSPIPLTVTFSESVMDFMPNDITVNNGTLSGFSGVGTTYTVNVTPTGNGAVTVNVGANVAQDAAGNGNTAATQFSIQYNLPNLAPTDIQLSNTTVAENQPNGTLVGNLTSTDPDAGQTFSYSLVSGAGSTDNTSFQLVGSQLRTATVFDFETKNSYVIRVQTTDNGTPALSFQKSFTITVTNVNETPTISPQTFAINENAVNGTFVGIVVAADPDAGTILTYSILSGNTNGAFALVGNSLNVANTTALDFETTPTFNLLVQVSDGNLTSSALVTVNLNNVAEGALSITPSSPAAVCAGAPVSLTATASGFSPTNYTWSSTPAGFAGSGASLTAFTQNTPSVSTNTSYTITATATDGTVTRTASVTLLVNALPTLAVSGNTAPSTCGSATGSIAFTTANLPNGVYSLTYTGAGSPKAVTVTGNAFSLTGLVAGTYSNFAISNGCTGTVATPVTLNDPVAPTLAVNSSTNPTSCSNTNGSITFSTNLANGPYSLTYTGTGSPQAVTVSSNAFTLTGLAAGTYSAFSISNNGCVGSAATSVTLTAPPAPTLTAGTGTNPSSCGGTNGSIAFTTNLPDGPYSLTYTGTGSPKTITVSTGTFSLSGLTAGIYSNFAISNGCVGSTNASVTLNDPAAPTLTFLNLVNPTSCGGANGTISFTTANLPDGPYSLTYTGTGSPKTVTISGNAFSLTGLVAGTYSNFAISNNGCTGSTAAARTLADPAAPTLTAGTGTNPSSCGGTNGSIAFTTNLPDGSYSLTYTGAGSPKTVTVSAGAFSLTGLLAGSYSNFAISNNGCTGLTATTVTLNDPLAPTLALSSSVNPSSCGGANGSIVFTTTNLPDGVYSLTYTGAGSPKTVTVSGNAFSLTGLSTGSYSNFAISNNGCVGSLPTSVTLNGPAAPTLTAGTGINPSSCGGTNGSIAFTTTNLPDGSYSLTYTGAGSPKTVTVSAGAFILTGLTAGAYSNFAISNNGCTGSTATTVTLNDPAAPTLAVSGSVNPSSCGGANGSIAFTTNLPDGSYSLTYTGTGSPKTVTVTNGTFSLTGLSAGSYSTFSLTSNGCTGSVATSVTLSDPAAPVATLINNGPFSCTTTSITLTASGGVSYTFSSGATQIGGNTGSTATVNSPGIYSVIVTASSGCTATATSSVTSDTAAVTASLVASGSINCANPSVTLTASPAGQASYVFSTGASQIGGQSGNTATVTAGGTYSVIVTSANGCSATASVGLSQDLTPPVVSITASPALTITQGQTATLTAAGASTYRWSTGATTSSITVSTGGPYSLTGTSTNGCSATATATVTVLPPVTTGPATLTITSFNCFSTNGALSSVNFVVGYSDNTYSPSLPPLFINGVTASGQLGVPYTVSFDSNAQPLPIQDNASRSTYFVWDYRAACAGPVTPPAPTAPVAPALPNQTAIQGTPFSYVVPAFTGTAPIAYSATGLPAGLSFDASSRTISGTPSLTGVSTVVISASNAVGQSSGQFTITVSGSATQPTGPATLTITSFNCFSTNGALSSVNFVVGYSNGTFTPAVADLFINGVTITGQLGQTYSFPFDANTGPLPIQDNASRSTYFTWDYRAACAGPVTPPAPTAPVAPGLPNQTATQGTPFRYVVPAFTGTAPITYTASGLPAGLSFDANTRIISGTPSLTGVSTVVISASNAVGQSSGQFTITVSGSATQPTGPATLTITSFNCFSTNGALSSVNFVVGYSDNTYSPSLPPLFINGVTASGQLGVPYTVSFDSNAQPLPIQDNASRSTYFVWDYRAACATKPSGTRLSAESTTPWSLRSVGNPVTGEVVVEVVDAQGQSLQLSLITTQGRMVETRVISPTTGVHREVFNVSSQGAGLLLLQAESTSRSQTLKVLKQ